METTVAMMNNRLQRTPSIKVYRRRQWMLLLFSLASMMDALTFQQYVVMANLNSCFYGVSLEAINWTSMIFMLIILVFSIPMSYVISNYLDLRWAVVCGAFANVVGSCLQFATVQPSGFVYVMFSDISFAIANIFLLGIPPYLAARWFPSHELSRACAFGVFGNQLGTAFGFLLSPLVVSSDCSQTDLITIGKRNVACLLTAVNSVIFILITFTFQNAPKHPPSVSEAEKKMEPVIPYKEVVLSMLRNRDFILILLTYGLMVGSYFALGTNLSELILDFFPNRQVEIGWMGLLMTVAGMGGALISGCILDCSKRFKETTFSICFSSFLTFIVFSGCLHVNQIWVQFITIGMFGFFLTSFLPVGFEYSIEVTYPQPEVVCSCLLNTSTMFFGIVLTEMLSHIRQSKGTLYSNAALTATLLVCCFISCFTRRDYKRSKKNAEIKHLATK